MPSSILSHLSVKAGFINVDDLLVLHDLICQHHSKLHPFLLKLCQTTAMRVILEGSLPVPKVISFVEESELIGRDLDLEFFIDHVHPLNQSEMGPLGS